MREAERRTVRHIDRQRCGKAVLWALAGSIAAPLAFAVEVAVIGVAKGEGIAVVPIAIWVSAFSIVGTVMYALLPYCVLLIGWAIVAPVFGAVDRSPGALVLITGVLALPAGLAGLALDDQSLYLGTTLWLAAWAGLLTPRLLIEQLRPGVFATTGISPPAA